MTIDKTIQMNIDFAKKAFEDSGEVRPMFIIHSEAGIIPVSIEFQDETQKSEMLNLVRLLMLKYKAYAYSTLMEAWTKQAKSRDEIKGRVCDEPDKKETLIVNYVGYDRKEMWSIEIKRDGESATLLEPVKFDGELGGRFFDLLPPKLAHEVVLRESDQKMMDTLIGLCAQRYGLTMLSLTPRKEG